MATFNYDRTRNTADRLLAKFGGTVFIETPESVLHKGFGVFSLIEHKNRPAQLTEENVQEFWLSADIDYDPQLGDYLLSGTNVWIITQVDPVQPNPEAVVQLYRLVVKL